MVEGVKNEIAEIKEDIEVVTNASVSASKNIAEYSSVGLKQVTEQAKVITDASKNAGTEFMKTDLTEFKKVLNEEAIETVQDVKEISSIVGGTLSGWASGIGKYVANSSIANAGSGVYEDDSEGIIIGKNNGKVNFVSAFEARLHNLRTDTATYCVVVLGVCERILGSI